MIEITPYYFVVGTIIGIYVILALSLNVITGYAGQPTLGHAAFFGIGAYTSALLTVKAGASFWLGLPVAGLVAIVVGAGTGVISLRLREDFFAVTTIGINFVVVSVFLYFDFFGGALGIGGIPRVSLWGQTLGKPGFFLLVLGLVALALAVSHWVSKSWLGLALEAIREDETAAKALGVDTARFKIVAFAIGTGLAGLAGSVYAHYLNFISPGDFAFPLSITILSMAVVGGLGTLRGPVFGAVVLGVLPEVFRPILEYRSLFYGGLLVVMLRFQPGGLLGHESVLYRALRAGLRCAQGAFAPGAREQPAPDPTAPDSSALVATEQRDEGLEILLEVRGLVKRFGGRVAVDRVDMAVRREEILGVIGPNGAGKTTLFNLISGLLRPDTGEIRLGGRFIHHLAPHRIARRGIGRTFQITRLFKNLSVRRNVQLALGHRHFVSWLSSLQFYDRGPSRAEAEALLGRMGLGGHAELAAKHLPLGLQRRLEVVRALALNPVLLLLDEPCAGLSRAEAAAVVELIRDVRDRGMTILLVEHNMAVAMRVCDQIVVLDYGQNIAEGTPAEIQDNPEVIRAYLGEEARHARD